jgi:hypothetical protein
MILAPGSQVRHFGDRAVAAVRTLDVDELGLIISLAD